MVREFKARFKLKYLLEWGRSRNHYLLMRFQKQADVVIIEISIVGNETIGQGSTSDEM